MYKVKTDLLNMFWQADACSKSYVKSSKQFEQALWKVLLVTASINRSWNISWLIVENTKIFWSYVKPIWIFLHGRNFRTLIVLFKHAFMNYRIMSLDRKSKTKLLTSSITYNLELLRKKNKFFAQRVS